jgi:hypothetical protein
VHGFEVAVSNALPGCLHREECVESNLASDLFVQS